MAFSGGWRKCVIIVLLAWHSSCLPEVSGFLPYFNTKGNGLLARLDPDVVNRTLLEITCQRNRDCQEHDNNSYCDDSSQQCRCKRHYYTYQKKHCLPGQLLSFPCKLDAQCQGRVANSLCVGGRCACQRGTVAFRLHTCMDGAELGQICYGNNQCRLKSDKTFCNFILRNVFGRCECLHGLDPQTGDCKAEFSALGQQCHVPGPCPGIANSICEPQGVNQAICNCSPGYMRFGSRYCIKVIGNENEIQVEARIKGSLASRNSAVSLGYPCSNDAECSRADPHSSCSEGFCKCRAFTDKHRKSKPRPPKRLNRVKRSEDWFCREDDLLRLCPEDTFQCKSNGVCISRYFVCDGKSDCSDGSDEQCSSDYECPRGSFTCQSSGKCLHVSKICNGKPDCPDQEDESGCIGDPFGKNSLNCPDTTFPCLDGSKCLPGYELCNSQVSCPDGSDEEKNFCLASPKYSRFYRNPWSFFLKFKEQRARDSTSDLQCPFRCDNGNCRAAEMLCSGKDGCGDNSDEEFCQICRCPAL